MTDNRLDIVVIGASGDLAMRKVLPALFALYCQGLLPKDFGVFGFARTDMSHAEFRARAANHLSCRYSPGANCDARMKEFLARCFYLPGRYDSRDSFLDLFALMRENDGGAADVLFYMAVPPSVFMDVAGSISGAGLVHCGERTPWSRVVIEKPFGSDRESSDALAKGISRVFSESQVYRIDHYLGKEAVQNLLVLRFSNRVFEPLWNSTHVQCVRIDWREDVGIGSRGGYFDRYGIIRDVIQNHMTQILALIAMEPPSSAAADNVRDEKLRVLKSISPVQMSDIALGQYSAGAEHGAPHRAYTDESAVPRDSVCPTYAAVRLRIENDRWRNVPFVVTAGKGLDTRLNEVRIVFRELPGNIFCAKGGCPPANELVIRIQPDEAMHLKIVNKEPGLNVSLVESQLDLVYRTAFAKQIPDAYECLLLDVIEGDKTLFIRGDELAAAWDIFTPLLREIDRRRAQPERYPFGSPGPASAELLFPA